MTDLDRYGSVLGKGLKRVRALLCLPDTQEEAAGETARYIARQLGRDLKDPDGLAGLYDRAKTALDLGHTFFGSNDAIDRLERLSPETLGYTHFIESLRCVADAGDGPERILERLAETAVQSTRDRLALQKDYRDDHEVHAAFDRHCCAITRSLTAHLKRSCGLGAVLVTRTLQSQSSLLEFVVVRE